MELENIMEESVKVMENDFYSKKFYFSYSSLNKLLWNPVVFHSMYILGIKEEKVDQHLVQGKIIHALLLEEENFNEFEDEISENERSIHVPMITKNIEIEN